MLSCIICPLEIVFPHNGFASSENGNVQRKRKLRMIINYLVKVNIGVCVQRGAFPPGAPNRQAKTNRAFFYQQEAISGSNQPSPGQAFHVHGVSKLGASHPSHSAAHPQPSQGSAKASLAIII